MFRALRALPNWPGLVLALGLAIGVGAYYSFDNYRRCVAQRDQHAILMTAVETAAAGERRLLLADVFSFSWDTVHVLRGLRPQERLLDCHFGWNISRTERRRLVEQDAYAVMAFARAGRPVRAVEVRGDHVMFGGEITDDTPLARDRAVFLVDGGGEAPFRLRLSGAVRGAAPE